MGDYRLTLLGDARLTRAGIAQELDTRKAIALLAYLAVTGRPHGRDTLAALLWPDSDQSGARGALRRTLSSLRKALPEGSLDAARESVALLEAAGVRCDAVLFREAVEAARGHQHPDSGACGACINRLEKAVALHAGDFMAGFSLRDSVGFDNWQFQEAEQFRRELAEALTTLASMLEAQGKYDRAIEHANKLLALDPLNETAHRRLMALYALQGQREAAFRQYRECVRILETELGVEPLQETTHLYEEIRSGQFSARRPGKPPAPGAARKLAPPGERATSLPAAALPGSQPAEDRRDQQRLQLVGRQTELLRLRQLYAQAGGSGRLVALSGEAGVGKTRLAEEFLAWVEGQGGRVLRTQCFEGETNLSYGAILEALRGGLDRYPPQQWARLVSSHNVAEASRLLPELAGAAPTAGTSTLQSDVLEGPGAQYRFFEGVSRVILAMLGNLQADSAPGVLFVDDLQWIDEASHELLAYLARRLAERRLLLLLTWQSGSPDAAGRLHGLLANPLRQGVAEMISLERLTTEQVGELLRSVEAGGKDIPEGWRSRLAVEAEGLPLYLVAYLHAATQAEDSAASQAGSPTNIGEIMNARLALLAAAETQVLQSAAVIGRSFDFDTLLETCGRTEEETVSAIEILIQRGLVRELTPASGLLERRLQYDFNHEQMRVLVYENLSMARRRLLHRRVAESLERRSQHAGAQQSSAPLSSQIAYHYRQSGIADQAAQHYRQAGDYARRLYANQEATQHFKNALALGHPERGSLHQAIADLETLQGNYASAIHHYEAAAAYSSPAEIADIERRIGLVYDRLGDFEQAAQHYQSALSAAEPAGQPGLKARLLADWSLTCHRSGDLQQAVALADQARRSIELSPEECSVLAQVNNLLGVLARRRGAYSDARRYLEESLAVAEGMESQPMRTAALNNMALVFGDLGDYPEAIERAEQALELCEAMGDRHRAAAIHNNLADLLQAAGRREEARQQVKIAVQLFAETGIELGQWQPEIWKLVEW
jgi:DNA-binding SARP family transcriptional activator/predicted ATPase